METRTVSATMSPQKAMIAYCSTVPPSGELTEHTIMHASLRHCDNLSRVTSPTAQTHLHFAALLLLRVPSDNVWLGVLKLAIDCRDIDGS